MAASPESFCYYDQSLKAPEGVSHYRGKVRDVFSKGDKVCMVVSDRISAFDHILPRPIPFKGQVLNGIAKHFLQATSDIVPNWWEGSPHPNLSIGKRCEPIRIEMVVRGHLTGHAWRTYKSGLRELCGVALPDGLKEHDPFPEPIITPATKAEEGHDEDISAEEILRRGIVSQEDWDKLCDHSLNLFARGQEMAHERGLILVDTKYEFGYYEGEIILIDEIHTPDSSRYFYSEGFEERQERGEGQQQLSKEFVREWLMEQGFQGLEGQTMPDMPQDFVWTVSERYRELYALVTGQDFEAEMNEHLVRDVEQALFRVFS
jgi:phosphoribosylaminoimidazole-succinocarboxamide synthase